MVVMLIEKVISICVWHCKILVNMKIFLVDQEK
jgi:hypothetical protein